VVQTTYTVPLALFDIVPVLLSALGCLLLARLSSGVVPGVRVVAYLGVVLIAAGGLSKALWKVLLTAAHTDIPILQQALFPLLSTGFVLLAWAVWSGLVGREVVYWPAALFLAVGVVGACAARTMQPLLGVAATAALITSGLGIRWAVRERAWGSAALFVVGMASSIGLAYLGGPKIEQTLSLQWVEESVNATGQVCFLLASWLLVRAVHHHSPASRAEVRTDTAVDV
jgi:hypothetical protein